MKKEKKNTDIDDVFEIVKFYHGDWEFRHKHFWSLLFKFFITNIVVTLLPFITSVSGVSFNAKDVNSSIIPLVGLLITVFSVYVLYGEAKRLSYVSATRNRIIKKCLPHEFRMEEFAETTSGKAKKRMAYAIVVYFGVFQVILEIATLILLNST